MSESPPSIDAQNQNATPDVREGEAAPLEGAMPRPYVECPTHPSGAPSAAAAGPAPLDCQMSPRLPIDSAVSEPASEFPSSATNAIAVSIRTSAQNDNGNGAPSCGGPESEAPPRSTAQCEES